MFKKSLAFTSAETEIVYKIILTDGISVGFCIDDVVVDIDGSNKGNNQFGKDVFLFVIENNILIPNRPANFSEYFSAHLGITNTKGGHYASGWIIDYDNMDYLKLSSDGKCPNGTTPTEQNPRCK